MKKHNPVTIRLLGGLGNQLFQYALGLTIRDELGLNVELDSSFLSDKPSVDALNIQLPIVSVAPNPKRQLHRHLHLVRHRILRASHGWKDIREQHHHFDRDLLKRVVPGAYLKGYWQSEMYFASARDTLKQTLFPADVKLKLSAEARIQGIAGTPVAIHFRGGDYFHQAQIRHHGYPSLRYYRRAIDLVSRSVPDAVYVAFTNDKNLLSHINQLKGIPPLIDMSTESALADFWAMRSCVHHICANSTYSWWASWLGGNDSSLRILPAPWSRVYGRRYSDIYFDGSIVIYENSTTYQ